MKKIFTTLFVLSFLLHFGQEKMITKTGTITFEASVPAFEEVKATNEKVSCVINTKTGELASLALMKGFRFKIALMEEHFNENYVESDQFPKAILKGKLANFNYAKLTESFTTFEFVGTMEMHGKTNPIKIPILIKKGKNGLDLKADFELNASDYDIEIPSVVSKKVSNKVKVTVNCELM
jgi:hypothetical protein